MTNLPWGRSLLYPLIDHPRDLLPIWTIIDAAWAHTQQSADHMQYCSHILSIGRVRWIAGTPYVGKDNSCWYRFQAEAVQTTFIGRAA